jgi:hypothetical protein
MTDARLDRILAAANAELLGHIEDTADSSQALAAIMTRYSRAVPPQETSTTTASGQDPDPAEAADTIRVRVRARALAISLYSAGDQSTNIYSALAVDNLARASAAADDLASDLAGVIADAASLAGNSRLASVLARDLGEIADKVKAARDFVRDIRLLDPRLALQLVGDIDYARDLARALWKAVAAYQVDASGADLSAIEIRDLHDLDGVIWTDQTTWPPGIASEVRVHSDEIRPGIYQVRLGDAPARHALVSV